MDDYSGIERLRMADVPDPVPGEGEVLLKVLFAGLNPADRYLAEREYPVRPSLPHILGRDAVGMVQLLGPGAGGLDTGKPHVILRGDVGGERPGTFAELVSVPTGSLVQAPENWTLEQSAGAALVYLTAYQALTMWGPLPVGSVVLVTGASGGVGVASMQLGRALGFRMVGLSRSAKKSKQLLELGAMAMFDPHDRSWTRGLKNTIAPERIALAVDNIGGKLLPQVVDTLGEQGKVSLVGRLAGPVPEFNTATLFFRRIRLGGVAVGAYAPEESRQAWREIIRLLALTGAKPLVDSIFPFTELPKAFVRLAQGPMGKVLLQARLS
jgi:NADPH2:quinone reductase